MRGRAHQHACTTVLMTGLASALLLGSGCAAAPLIGYSSPSAAKLHLGNAEILHDTLYVTKAESISFLTRSGVAEAEAESMLEAVRVLTGCKFGDSMPLSHEYVTDCQSRLDRDIAQQYVTSYNELLAGKIEDPRSYASNRVAGLAESIIEYGNTHNAPFYFAATALDLLTTDSAPQDWQANAEELNPEFLAKFTHDSWFDKFVDGSQRMAAALNSRGSTLYKKELPVLVTALASSLAFAHDEIDAMIEHRETVKLYVDWLEQKFHRFRIHGKLEIVVLTPPAKPREPPRPLAGPLLFDLALTYKTAGDTVIPLMGICRRKTTVEIRGRVDRYACTLQSHPQNTVTSDNFDAWMKTPNPTIRYTQVQAIGGGGQTNVVTE